MKHLITKLLVSVLAAGMVLSLGGCTKKEETTPPTDGTTPPTTTTDPSAPTEKITAALMVGNKNDKSFYESAVAGMERAKTDMANEYELTVVEMTSDQAKWEDSIYETVDNGTDIVISLGYQLQAIFEKIAPEYPDTKFVYLDGTMDYTKAPYENIYSVTFEANQSGFLAGMLAAKLTTSGNPKTNPEKVVGFVGALENNIIIADFLVGYIEGVHYVDPEIKVVSSYVGGYLDTAKAKELALVQMNNDKADVIFSVAGGAGTGVIEAAFQNKALVIGVDSDQALIYEGRDEQEAIVTSALKCVDNMVYEVLQRNLKGEIPWGTMEIVGLKESAVGLVYNDILSANVSEDIIKELKDAEQKIISGEIKVSRASALSAEELAAKVKG